MIGEPQPAAVPIRVLLDVNVWVASLLSRARGRGHSASQHLTGYAFAGRCPAGALRLVTSERMLHTLGTALFRRLVRPIEIDLLLDAIRLAAGVNLPVGGGVVALPDQEDATVLEAAFAGEAGYLVTADMGDFARAKDAVAVAPGVLCIPRPRQPVVVAAPAWSLAVLQDPVRFAGVERQRLGHAWIGGRPTGQL